MHIKDLIKKLQKLPQDAEIFLSRDAEGNGFHNIEEIACFSATDGEYVIWPKHESTEMSGRD